MRRSTHAGASVGGGDGVPIAEPRKRFAGQQGLRHLMAFERAMQYSPVFQSLVATRSCYTAQSLRSSRQVLLKGSMSHHAMEKDVLTMWCCRSRMLLVRSLRSPDSSAFGVSKCTFGPSNEEQMDRNGRKLRISLPGWAPSLGTSKSQALLRPGRCY